ncbi:DNA recombination protein RmuC [Alginatibacterium sediminis]|uniref:DNA recombination protein RmuC n=1 Tax=Alginatibacterium sediminis TaxID=2164068 RepID=A0A420EAW6_9ALTE|nr:DNA recombination protein RmuC [Alginatibacterium sediminis]RKF17837.1 DNA recombination protein RmuC [Alginatibacterium sediminis]
MEILQEIERNPLLVASLLSMITLLAIFWASWQGRARKLAELANVDLEARQQQVLEQQLHETDALRDQVEYSQQQLQDLRIQAGVDSEKLKQSQITLQNYQALQAEFKTQSRRLQDFEVEESALTKRIEFLQQNEQRFTQQFENLSRQILEQNTQRFSQQSESNINQLLSPMRQQLEQFKGQVQHVYENESKQRFALKEQVLELQKLNVQMSEDAQRLTQALKGDNKQAGNWGELVLEQVLSDAGLRKGHEYHTQVSGRNESQQLIQPDVIVELPDQRFVIIDAKLSLVAYERYFASDDETARKLAIQDHLRSMRGHLKGLSKKRYQSFHGKTQPEFVLMFVPIEAAFLAAVQEQPALLREGVDAQVLLVSPSSLLIALRTIHQLWQQQYQQQNAQKIVERASKLLDKFVLFNEDLELHGHSLKKASESYEAATRKLNSGPGNLIRQAQQLQALHVPVKKTLPVSDNQKESEAKPESKRAQDEQDQISNIAALDFTSGGNIGTKT